LESSAEKRLAVAVLAFVVAGSLAAFEFAKPVIAAVAPPASAPLDDNSVAALLTLDRAMETLAARITRRCECDGSLKTQRSAGGQRLAGYGAVLWPVWQSVRGNPSGRSSGCIAAAEKNGAWSGSGVIISPDGYSSPTIT